MAKATKETDSLPIQGMSAEVRASSFDEAANTIEVVWTTGASVRRYSWREGVYYDEVLETGGNNVRLGRLNAGAPLLDTHDSWELSRVLGSVVEGTARMEGGKGLCKVRLSQAPEHAGIVANIRAGVIRNISVGYAIHEVLKTERGEGEVAEWRVTDWEPLEISAVPIPADAGSQFRNAGEQGKGALARMFPVVFRSVADPGDETDNPTPEPSPAGDAAKTEEKAMSDRDQTTGNERGADTNIETRTVPTPGLTPEESRTIAATAVAEERKRAADIRDLAKRAGKADLGETFIADGKTVDDFRAALLDALVDQQAQGGPAVGSTGLRATVFGAADKETRAEAMTQAILHRHDAMAYKLDDKARDFRGMTLLDMARDCLEAEGVSTRRMSRQEVAQRALEASTRAGGMHSSSDFPIVLANVANKTLRAGYDAAPQTFRPLVRVVSVPDFKTVDRVQLGEAPQFEKVNEHGEFKRGTIGEGKESFKIATYGKVIGITRQVIINDDLSAFTRIPQAFGVQAANLESDLVWAQIIGNPTMGDGTTLFHNDHGNLLASAAIGAVGVAAGFVSMGLQKGLDGKTLLNIRPQYIIAPLALQMTVAQFLAPITPTQQSQTTPDYLKALDPIIEPRLDGGFTDPATKAAISGSSSNWYLAAAPGMIDTVELAYLEGNQGVYTETRTGFDVDGVEVKVRLDAGAKTIDYRAFAKNPN